MPAVQSLLSEAPLVHLEPGTILLRRGSQPEFITYIDHGRVSLGLLDALGALEHQLGVMQGPGWLDATAVLLGSPCPVDAVAETHVALRRMSCTRFFAALAAHNSNQKSLLLDIARAHRQQLELAVSRVAKDAEARCAEWLLRCAQTSTSGSYSVEFQQRKRLVAAQLGMAPETLSRVLRHLRERSLISGTGQIIQLVDLEGLKALAGT